jgi:hypothetical protein
MSWTAWLNTSPTCDKYVVCGVLSGQLVNIAGAIGIVGAAIAGGYYLYCRINYWPSYIKKEQNPQLYRQICAYLHSRQTEWCWGWFSSKMVTSVEYINEDKSFSRYAIPGNDSTISITVNDQTLYVTVVDGNLHFSSTCQSLVTLANLEKLRAN